MGFKANMRAGEFKKHADLWFMFLFSFFCELIVLLGTDNENYSFLKLPIKLFMSVLFDTVFNPKQLPNLFFKFFVKFPPCDSLVVEPSLEFKYFNQKFSTTKNNFFFFNL